MRRVLALLSVVLVLSGCAFLNIKRPVAQDDLRATRRVGVISMLGDTFQGVSVGTTIFNNKYFSGSVPDWSVDKYASNAALELLLTNSRFTSMLLDRSNLTDEQAKADGGKLLWQAAEQQGLDRIVVIRPGVSDNYRFFKPGYGLFERSHLGNSWRCVYAAYVVDVYDVSRRKSIAWEWGGRAPCEQGKDSDLAFKAKYTDYSEADLAEMRRRLEVQIADSVRYSLVQLSLVPVGAVVGERPDY